MTERQPGSISGDLQNREEYHFLDSAAQHELKESSLISIEDALIAERGNNRSGLFYTFTEGIAVRKLVLSHVDTTQDDAMLFVNGYESELRQVVRHPTTTDITVRTKHYREGHLQETAKVSIREYVTGSRMPFISRYLIERYAGDVIHATVGRTDAVKSQGLDEREMLPYDFAEFQQQMNVIVAMRKASLIGAYGE